jgi:choline-sulfatase
LPHRPWVDPWAAELAPKTAFTEMVAYLDDILGRLVAAAPDNTIVVFTADNGTDVRVGGGKGTLTDLGCNVPLVVGGDALALGRQGVAVHGPPDHRLIDLTDFYPTFAELAGASADPLIDGQSFFGPPRETVCLYRRLVAARRREWALRGARYKLRHDGRLFDLAIDPRERDGSTRDRDQAARDARRRLSAAAAELGLSAG